MDEIIRHEPFPNTLKSLSFTSRTIRQLLYPAIFRSVTRGSSYANPFSESFSNPPPPNTVIPSYVHKLVVRSHAELDTEDFRSFVLTFPHLSEIQFMRIGASITRGLMETLSLIPKLRHLSLDDCVVQLPLPEDMRLTRKLKITSFSMFGICHGKKDRTLMALLPYFDSHKVSQLVLEKDYRGISYLTRLTELIIDSVSDKDLFLDVISSLPGLIKLINHTMHCTPLPPQFLENGDRARNLHPELTELKCHPIILSFFVDSPLQHLDVSTRFALYDEELIHPQVRSLPSFSTVTSLALSAFFLLAPHVDSTLMVKDLFPNVQTLTMHDYWVSKAVNDLAFGLYLRPKETQLEVCIFDLCRRAHELPAITKLVFDDEYCYQEDPVIEERVVKQHLAYAFPTLEVVEFQIGGIWVRQDEAPRQERIHWKSYPL
jgi:hypothetical protein